MKKINRHIQRSFEKLASFAISILGNSITFIIALCIIIYWIGDKKFSTENIHTRIGDAILGVTFLSLFIIQKSFNRFSASMYLKVNELVASHGPANNSVINLEEKTELEITELSKEYTELAAEVKEITEEKSEGSVTEK